MLAGMRLALVLGTCALVAQVDAKPGKVVRVERKSRRFGGEPRMCGVTAGLTGYCYGKQPQPGDRVTFLDATHMLGVATVEKVESYGSCKGTANTMWTVHFRSDTAIDFNGEESVTGLLDVTVGANAKVMAAEEAPPNRPLESASTFDLDGDGRRDLEFLAFTCDDHGDYVVPGLGATNLPSTCIEMWYAKGHTFERLQADRITSNCF